MAMKRVILRTALLLPLLTASVGGFAQEKPAEPGKAAEPEKVTPEKAAPEKAPPENATGQEKAAEPEKAAETIDCSAFRKENYGYLVTKTTRIATPPLDVTVPKGMPIRRGQKAAEVQGKNLADVIAEHCAG
jgi:hypothetical protein